MKAAVKWAALAAGALALGCGSTDDEDRQGSSLELEDNVRVWATTASAVAVYSTVYEPLAFADGERTFDDPACPITSDDGTTATITGGCLDGAGRSWVGSAAVVRADDGSRTLTLSDYASFDDPEWAVSIDGTAVVRPVDADTQEFELDLVHSGGVTTTVRYSGSIDGGYAGPTRWNGSGTVTREGDFPPIGTVQATTLDELVDDALCSGQPAAGRTTLDDGEHTAVVDYDGATDCDPDRAARFSVDGEDRGLVTGITCRIAGAGLRSATPGAAGVGLMLALAAFASRRSAVGGLGRVRRSGARENR